MGDVGRLGGAGRGAFFADRLDLPFVSTVLGSGTEAKRAGAQRLADAPGLTFERFWTAPYAAWRIFADFTATAGWRGALQKLPPDTALSVPDWKSWPLPPSIEGAAAPTETDVQRELDLLVRAAEDERGDAMGEILSQADDFITDFMALLAARPGVHGATARLLHAANLVASLGSMHFKHKFQRPRPSQLCPALKPPLEVPGHASYPSGHATQAFLMAHCLAEALDGTPHAPAIPIVEALATRIARNREIAGLHYRSDTLGGQALARGLFGVLKGVPSFNSTVRAAKAEWA